MANRKTISRPFSKNIITMSKPIKITPPPEAPKLPVTLCTIVTNWCPIFGTSYIFSTVTI